MGLPESRGKLGRSMRDLLALWSTTKMSWNDANAERFEQEFLQPLEADVRTAANAMDQMSSLLSQIRHQCE